VLYQWRSLPYKVLLNELDMTTLIGGRYEIIEKLLGEGGFGITYTAPDRGLPNDPIVVVKELISQPNFESERLKKTQKYFHSSVKDFQSSFTGDILEIAPTADKDESCERLLLNIKSVPPA
jgi:serine/threonine protein kinase